MTTPHIHLFPGSKYRTRDGYVTTARRRDGDSKWEFEANYSDTEIGVYMADGRFRDDGLPSPHDLVEEVETVRVREGKFYRRRDGEVVGPAGKGSEKFPWTLNHRAYQNSGAYYYDTGDEHALDLIAEVPEPASEQQPTCGECHSELTEVRPGSHQCDTCEAEPAPPAVDVGEGWRLLEDGEVIQEGDEWYGSDRW